MFNLQGGELLIILVLALVVLGPEKLPEAMRRIGRAYAELRRMGTGFTQEFRSAIDEPMRDVRRTVEETTATIDEAVRSTGPSSTSDTTSDTTSDSTSESDASDGRAATGTGSEETTP